MPVDAEESKILQALLQEENIPKSYLIKNAGISSTAVQNGVKSLVEKGLITERPERRDNTTKAIIKLTIFGRKVAVLLDEAEDLIRESVKHA